MSISTGISPGFSGIEDDTVFIGLLYQVVIAGEGRAKEYVDRRTIRLHREDKRVFKPPEGRRAKSPGCCRVE